jgi:hypothetical protein
MSVVQFRRRASTAALAEGYGPDEIRWGRWVCAEVLLWMRRTPAELRRECRVFLSDDEIDDLESQRHIQRRKIANG